MSGLGTGISAFVNGFVGGRDVRNRWDDRKIDQARQERLDQIRENQDRRAQEAHEVNLEGTGLINQARRQSIRQTDQDWGDSRAMREALSQADQAAEGGLLTNAGISTSGTATLGAMPDAVAPEPARGSFRIPEWDATVPWQETPLGLGAVASDPVPAAPAQPQPDQSAAPASAPAQPRPPRSTVTRLFPAAPDGGYQPTDNRQHQWAQPGGLSKDIQQAGRVAGDFVGDALARTGETIVNEGVDVVRGINRPLQAASEYALGRDVVGAPERVDLNNDGLSSTLGTPLAQSWGAIRDDGQAAAAQASAPGTDGSKAQVATAAETVMNNVGDSPSMKAAADAVPVDAMGATRGKPMTEAKRDQGAKTFMESYRKNGAPIVMRELLRQGRIDQAEKFDEFVRSGTAREGMDAWGRGMFAAMQGDVDGAADNLLDAYNAAGYYDDGYEILRDDSALIRDNGGDVVGVRLAMRNQTTGEVVVQQDRIDNFIQRALWITSPEKAFEAASARMAAQQDALLKADAERRGAATDLIKAEPDRIARAAQEIYKNSIGLDGQPTMTYAEALQEAQGAFSGQGAAAPLDGEVPVARRPQ
ncbi:hypothetical protein [Paracoccus alcaliphilus]|uniref:hypothetical protein n=1 Tax=Paracoccus alcaliphilus TaxID=34002 RepID=UPI002350E5CA|nr:hypothetical protein [Paracoccus alcaliphilus]WCR17508.1 hypothetical protein JHW40_14390 [Paracoccus alcaliphilus]